MGDADVYEGRFGATLYLQAICGDRELLPSDQITAMGPDSFFRQAQFVNWNLHNQLETSRLELKMDCI